MYGFQSHTPADDINALMPGCRHVQGGTSDEEPGRHFTSRNN
jgi:hypothetical protein